MLIVDLPTFSFFSLFVQTRLSIDAAAEEGDYSQEIIIENENVTEFEDQLLSNGKYIRGYIPIGQVI